MAKQKIKVETDTLTQLAGKYKTLAEEYKACCEGLENKLKEYDAYWKGSFSEDFDDEIKNLKKEKNKVYDNCVGLANFLDEAVKLYKQVDQGLIPKDTVNRKDYPDGVEVSEHIPTDEELRNLYKNSVTSGIGKNPDGSVSCAALTKRKAQQHGFNYIGYGNGNQVYDRIQSNESFNVTKYSGGDCLSKLVAAEGEPVANVVISFPRSPKWGNKYGHVIYIDKIVNGKVYYSDNNSPSTAKVKTIDEFLRSYNGSNGSPIGCAHLKKK
ncbi:MAG: WXG100 family type VII secretion target [Clostridia bacterium]|nr:WXG100 family type VII secretion target [Clostridia bacterium]